MTDELERNKKTVIEFYELMFNECRPVEAVERFAGDAYIQHNPGVADGKEGFIKHFLWMAQKYPGKHVHFKRVIAEGQYGVLHCHTTWPGEADGVNIDIFRLDDHGKLVEHWDVLQTVAETSANANTMF